MSALPYEPFAFAGAQPFEWFIERVGPDRRLADRIAEWKQLNRDGWDVTALCAPDNSVVAFGCRGIWTA